MGKKTAFLTIIFGLLVVVGGATIYILFFEQPTHQSKNTKAEVDLPLEAALNNQHAKTPVQDTTNNNSQSQLPKPSEFDVYEQYANAESTQYIDTEKGSGSEATRGTTAHVVYTGYLTNGQIFDQSRINENGQLVAFSFTLGAGQVIQGWEQGIAGMKEGGKRRLIIPSQFGYGEQGQDPIPPNSMLIFDVELVQVDPPQIAPTP